MLLDPQRSPTLTGSLFLKDAGDLEHLAIGENLTSRMLSMGEAAKFLSTDTGAMSAFKAAGLLRQGDRHLGVTLGNLESFRERYVLSGEIVGRSDISWFELTRKLKAAGIEPAREWFSEDGRPFRRIYDRRQVEAFLEPPAIRR